MKIACNWKSVEVCQEGVAIVWNSVELCGEFEEKCGDNV